MSARTVLFALLGVVATAAAVLSFAALRDLALVCGFASQLAWLLPVVIDAGAAAGSLVWLGGWTGNAARTFARALALALLALSVAANALGHGLEAFTLAPAWWVVVIVSAVAPAVLGSVVHLAVLVGRPANPSADLADEEPRPYAPAHDVDDRGMSQLWTDAASSRDERIAALIAEGAGRRRLSRELDISEYEARRLLSGPRAQQSTPPDSPAEPAAAPPQLELNGARRPS